MIAVGLGCRASCDARDIVRVVRDAIANAAFSLSEVHALYAPERKRHHPALASAAATLGKPLVFLPMSALEAQARSVLTVSAVVARHIGVPCVCETAALAGAHSFELSRHDRAPPMPRLLGPRRIHGGATCALAQNALREECR